ncbi:uncharacterized protein BDW47DRAFT_121286 [Aspergillus candidus]|uniref:FAD/NAD(P)-binding domain-containing protein n=1 Tax=Aspergillus candidus TaxID=41067 RepID=A0A2I2EYD3_ASPCN|nr:hypothetical protein BDW47DRAFT_121286 [Aspergillus candidus]PLB33364.1 hypothetical protein BDW47DRAFT_121286 [Aspergillus candidus]
METDTIIVGNGPSAMLLSFILHGNIPYYSSDPPHPDPLLDAKLKDAPDLLNADVPALTEHFAASRLSYSTQALPVNVLLDTLVRPSVDVEELSCTTNIEWRRLPEKSVSHLVFGHASQPGGQWVENPMPGSWEIQTLSYASMLSLPGYSFAEHYRRVTGKDLPAFTRPSRQETADYFRAYPEAVQINDTMRCHETLNGISRTASGFYIRSHNIHCKRLVLASGIFSEVLQPRPLLQPLATLQPVPELPLLVIGSGFSAADVIISAPKDQKIIHVYKWSPENRPSPLRGCHQQAYPEYSGVYRLMRRAAVAAEPTSTKKPRYRRLTSTPFLTSRTWDDVYEGLPNTEIIGVDTNKDDATVTFRAHNGSVFTRRLRGMVYATGRRGTLKYLDNGLLAEVVGQQNGPELNPIISGQTLRSKALDDMEVTKDLFIIGSLTGDSLIRFSYGSCVQTAGKLIGASSSNGRPKDEAVLRSKPQGAALQAMHGMDGHAVYPNHNQYHIDSGDNHGLLHSLFDKLGLGGVWTTLARVWYA